MEMPKTCAECPLYDEEFYYCHGHREYQAWEVLDMVRYEKNRPTWCPLKEIRYEA